MVLAPSSVSCLLRKVLRVRRVFPDGMLRVVVGIGGASSFCCRLSAITKKARKPTFMRYVEKCEKQMLEKLTENKASSTYILHQNHISKINNPKYTKNDGMMHSGILFRVVLLFTNVHLLI